MAGKGKGRKGAASMGVIGLMLFGSGSSGGGFQTKTASYGSQLFRTGSSQQREQQSRAVRNGTTDSSNRRRGSGQR